MSKILFFHVRTNLKQHIVNILLFCFLEWYHTYASQTVLQYLIKVLKNKHYYFLVFPQPTKDWIRAYFSTFSFTDNQINFFHFNCFLQTPALPFTPALKLQIPLEKRQHKRLGCLAKYICNRKFLVMRKTQ